MGQVVFDALFDDPTDGADAAPTAPAAAWPQAQQPREPTQQGTEDMAIDKDLTPGKFSRHQGCVVGESMGSLAPWPACLHTASLRHPQLPAPSHVPLPPPPPRPPRTPTLQASAAGSRPSCS